MAQVWRIPEPPAVMYYHGLWIVADGCERSGPIEDYNAAQWITTNCAKPLTTPRRYGADMAHTVASIGHVLSWSYHGLFLITMDYRLSWAIMDYRGLSWIMVDYNGLRTMVD